MAKLDKSLFVSTEVHTRIVRLPDGTEAEFHFRELPAIELRRQHLAETSSNPDERARAIARLISVGLCDVEGNPVLTEEEAARLKASVAGQFVQRIMEVSGFVAAAQPKND